VPHAAARALPRQRGDVPGRRRPRRPGRRGGSRRAARPRLNTAISRMLRAPSARSVRALMTFVDTLPEEGAPDAVAAMYAADRERFGTLPNFTRAFSLRPEVYAAWRALHAAIAANMDLRR